MEFTRIIRSPVMVSEPKENVLLYNNMIAAPAIPKVIPVILPIEIFSLRTTAAMSNTTIGLEIIMIAALIGVVILNPFKKSN